VEASFSPNGRWEARNYYIAWDEAFDGSRGRVIIRRVGEKSWKQVYAGYPVDMKWRGQAELVLRDEQSGATHSLSPARGDEYKEYMYGSMGGVVGMFIVFLFFVGLSWLLSVVVVKGPERGVQS
jgi:hypothetical protein